ncbi:MAG: N-acetyl-gamma-glutamyl-phosphate reductase [Ktedonobacterales bacterium]
MQDSQSRIAVAVVNGTGYGGVELVRLLSHHPAFDLVEVTARSEAGKAVADVFPSLPGLDLTFSATVKQAELVFVALPDHAAVEQVPGLLAEGRRVVDLSAGFRLKDAALYPRWYKYEHTAPALLEEAVYGLAEWARDQLPEARLVACPGCYPTAALLALCPAFQSELIEPDVVIDAKSGLSGAGRTPSTATHYSEANEDTSAYGLDGHRHWPEMYQEFAAIRKTGRRLSLTFTPHYVPMTRGILATCYAALRPGVTREMVLRAYTESYRSELFVRITSTSPHTKWALGSNLCFVYPTVAEESGKLVVLSALDNLIKGAAGQAVQCANLMYRLPEDAGLPVEGLYP